MSSAFVLHESGDRNAMLRWSGSAALMIAAHVAVIALATAYFTQSPSPGVSLPTIMVDLSPIAAQPNAPKSTQPQPPDVSPIDTPPPPEPPSQEAVQQALAPAPPEPVVQTPPLPEPAIVPTPAKSEPKAEPPEHAKPAPAKPKPVHSETKKLAAIPPPRSAASNSERQNSAASAISGAVSAAAIASYNQRVAAHLQSFKQYPASARAAGEQGVSRLSFTLGRNGQVLGSHLAGSSGHAALDGETLAMVRRAQPFPPMPPELKQASISFTVPIRFSMH
jgi:periplasmic protein TonB